jgi:phage-related protein
MAPCTEARPLVWLHGEIKTPPFSLAGRIDAGELLRQLQRGERVGMPHSRPLPSIGPGCHELRIWDSGRSWRIVYCVDVDAILIVEVFAKKTRPPRFTSSRRVGRGWPHIVDSVHGSEANDATEFRETAQSRVAVWILQGLSGSL